MSPADALVLRDIHQAPAPPWWPPAPGWWLLAGALCVVLALLAAWRLRLRRRRARILSQFEREVDDEPTPAAQVTAMSSLLRRAARLRDPEVDRLHGDAWLQHLRDHAPGAGLDAQDLDLLREGGFRRDIDPARVARLREAARACVAGWMGVRP